MRKLRRREGKPPAQNLQVSKWRTGIHTMLSPLTLLLLLLLAFWGQVT